MALFYTGTWRGTIAALNWAVRAHWRAAVVDPDIPEDVVCLTLATGLKAYWSTIAADCFSAAVNLTKVVVTAYGEPTGFAEVTAAIAGGQGTPDICPPFVAKGIRQFRSNQDFRTATHRMPEVMEKNNVNGSWVFSGLPDSSDIAAMVDIFGNARDMDVPDTMAVINFQPVLIRTQMTEGSDRHPPKTVTYFTPPQISDVQSAAFYGITSQVSRKYILPS